MNVNANGKMFSIEHTILNVASGSGGKNKCVCNVCISGKHRVCRHCVISKINRVRRELRVREMTTHPKK